MGQEKQDKKLWEAEFFAMDFETHELTNYTSGFYFEGVNFEEASKELKNSGLTYLRLTGKYFKDTQSVYDTNAFYEKIIKPSNLVKDMSYDDFIDWLDLGDEEDVMAALDAFKKDGVTEYVKIIKAYLKNRYGTKNEEKNDNEEDSGQESSKK